MSTSELDDILAGVEPSGKSERKKESQKKLQQVDSKHPKTITMGSTLRIPWVYRVKVWVLRGFWALPLFGAFMMVSAFQDWGMGWKTTIFAIICYMIHFGCAAMVRFIDPEDWKLVEQEIKRRDITNA